MGKYLNIFFLCLTVLSVGLVNCVPTSVLVDTKPKETNKETTKAIEVVDKVQAPQPSGIGIIGSGDKPKYVPQKRGVNPQQIDLSNDILVNRMPPNGIWEDTDASLLYPELQDIEDYQRARLVPSDNRKAYENLQNLLNSQIYSEPIALPLEYPYRFYGDRKKRSNEKKKKTLRLKKRETKLTPADLLALVALVEAGERSRLEDVELPIDEISNSILPYGYLAQQQQQQQQYQQQLPSQLQDDNGEWLNSWTEPAVEYYGMPIELSDSLPAKYDRHFNKNLPSKRFMVAKKKRTNINNNNNNNRDWRYGQERFLSEPVQMQEMPVNYDYGRYAVPDGLENGPRNFHRYI